ncbi:hypothetical protein [Flavihumibacter fluvii]|uniref:hypothetical protein n=1 Tax=Flavihumibacter fluvii TaxID=2838157 RepID=UPI001BDEE39B|nr:hypothetical protein [Flavihumibacter fluvii]ULQ53706.1 hypothetical protein KJS93_05140 [Flavihumibacter fluvii]
MQLIKLILISAIAFFLLLTAFTLFIPSTIRISRAIDISSDRKTILPYVQQLPKWKDWNLYLQDTSGRFLVRLVSISDSLVTSTWLSGHKEFNSGLAIYEMRQGTTTVQWYFDFELKWYPWEKIASIVYDRQMGGVMQESLVKLKERIESNP